MAFEWNLEPVRETNDLHRAMNQQQADLAAEQAQTIVELTGAQKLQTIAFEAHRAELAAQLEADSIGSEAAKTLRELVASPEFFRNG